MKSKITWLVCCIFSINFAFAGQIGLNSGEVLDAKSIQLPKEIEVVLPDGKKKTLQTSDIQTIELNTIRSIQPLLDKEEKLSEAEIKEALNEFKALKPFETPKQTFLTWKESANEGSIDGMVHCYAKYRQDAVHKKLKKIKKKDRKEMQHTMQMVDFTTSDPMYQGSQAFLEVTWAKGLQSETQILKFVLEEDQWKIIE